MSGIYEPRDSEPGPLAGISVLDLTIARAGPTCVRQLADLGAEVVQVAAPRSRQLGGSDAHNLHRGKRSIGIDLKHARGRAVFYRLVEKVDVVVENFRSDVKQRLEIEYSQLSAINPRLIYASLSGFGQEGPYRSRPGLDQIAQGMGGLMSVTGPPGQGPWRTGIAISDTAAGTFLTQGVLAALFERERTGRGQWVHTSLLEAMVNFMDFQAARWLIDGQVPGQAGNDHPTLFPMGTFRTRDGQINIAVLTGWERFLEAIDGQALADDPRFADFAGRATHREPLREAVEAKLGEKTTAEWLEIFSQLDLPCGPVLSLDQVFEDPQVQHLQLTRKVEHAVDGELELLRFPVTFSQTPAGIRGAPPLAGADTREILAERGFSESEISELIETGAVTVGGERQPGPR